MKPVILPSVPITGVERKPDFSVLRSGMNWYYKELSMYKILI